MFCVNQYNLSDSVYNNIIKYALSQVRTRYSYFSQVTLWIVPKDDLQMVKLSVDMQLLAQVMVRVKFRARFRVGV